MRNNENRFSSHYHHQHHYHHHQHHHHRHHHLNALFSDSDGERLKLEWETIRIDSPLIIIINITSIVIIISRRKYRQIRRKKYDFLQKFWRAGFQPKSAFSWKFLQTCFGSFLLPCTTLCQRISWAKKNQKKFKDKILNWNYVLN